MHPYFRLLSLIINPFATFLISALLIQPSRQGETDGYASAHIRQSVTNSRAEAVVEGQFPETEDMDGDGLADALEQELAEKYAPIIFHAADEPNLPVSVVSFLEQTELWFYDERCRPERVKLNGPLRDNIPHYRQPPCTASDGYSDSHGTRSRNKRRTFFLQDVSESARQGSLDPRAWTTYYHAYPNDIRGVTIQYWRFYAYNTGVVLGHRSSIGSHGGDWEAIHVVLDATYKPVFVHFLGHRSISTKPWASLMSEGFHLLVKSEKGGHTSRPFTKGDENTAAAKFIRQETWSTGHVTWPKGHRLRPPDSSYTKGAALVNLGEKTAPMKGANFIQYSGLWGSRKSGGLFPRLRSGYWGPAFNETSMSRDNFITAWCKGMIQPLKGRMVVTDIGVIRECYPTNVSR